MRTADITLGDWYALKPDNAYGLGPIYLKVSEIHYKDGYKTPWLTCVKPLTEEPVGQFRPSDFSHNYNDDGEHARRALMAAASSEQAATIKHMEDTGHLVFMDA